QLAQQLACPLVVDIGRSQHHLDNLISAPVLARVKHPLFSQPELLPVLRTLWNLQQRPAIDRWNLDLRTEPRLAHRKRHLDMDVITFAPEKGMPLHTNSDVQIARRSSRHARVAFARHAQPRAVRHSL